MGRQEGRGRRGAVRRLGLKRVRTVLTTVSLDHVPWLLFVPRFQGKLKKWIIIYMQTEVWREKRDAA